MKENIKYSICIQGTQTDWYFNGYFRGDYENPNFFIFYDEKADDEYIISWDKLIWFKERVGFR